MTTPMLTKGMCYRIKAVKSSGFTQFSYYVALSISELLRVVPTQPKDFIRLESRKLITLDKDLLVNLGVCFYG